MSIILKIYFKKVLAALSLRCLLLVENALYGLSLVVGERGLLSSCGVWASHCGGFSCSAARVLGFGLCSCGAQA